MDSKFGNEEIFIASIQNQLIERKSRLNEAINLIPNSQNLYKLLKEVDFALERIDKGTYGLCEVCNDPIETDRLLANPLLTLCIDHLTSQQQRALELDLQYAGKIQRALLPKNEINTGEWDFVYHYQPAGTVSGDFCDLIENPDKSLTFLIGDVSGKGVSASLMMSHLHALIHSLLSFNLPIKELVERVNRLFCESTLSMNYATMVVGKALPDGALEICVAGHNPPLIYNDKRVSEIGATGVPVGLFCNSEYSIISLMMDRGDTLLLYTDGLTEAMNGHVEYGDERVKLHFASVNNLEARELVNTLLLDNKAFLQNSTASDDVTVAVLKRL